MAYPGPCAFHVPDVPARAGFCHAEARERTVLPVSSMLAGPELDEGWERALQLAWDAFCGRTTPVGAVVLNSSAVIVAEGRGRRYEETGPPRQLAGTHIAHAEVNALAQLGADRHYQDHLLLTTLEPCGMCHGAAVQATVGSVAYAGSDPYGGTGDLAFGTPQARQRPLQVSGPLEDERGRLAELLHIVWILQLPAGPHVLAAQQAGLPARTRLAARARTLRLFTDAASSRASLAELRSALHGTI
jgi:tRNA(Arg) A34 adenosine deaminase TadA